MQVNRAMYSKGPPRRRCEARGAAGYFVVHVGGLAELVDVIFMCGLLRCEQWVTGAWVSLASSKARVSPAKATTRARQPEWQTK